MIVISREAILWVAITVMMEIIIFSAMYLGVCLKAQGASPWSIVLCAFGIPFGAFVASFGVIWVCRDYIAEWGSVYIGNRTLVFLASLGSCGLLVVLWSVGCMVLFGAVFTVIIALCLLMMAISTYDVVVVAFNMMFERVWEEADE